MRLYAKLHGFETVFDSDPYVEVGVDERSKIRHGPGSNDLHVREATYGLGASLVSLPVEC